MTTGYRLDFPWPFVWTAAANQNVGARLYVYENGTTTPVSLYSDRGCTTPADNPVVSASGFFAPTFVAAAALHTLVLKNTAGSTLLSANDISPFQDSQQANALNQAIDATLSALGGLSTTADKYIRATGTDTFTMDSYATVLANLLTTESDLSAIAALSTSAAGRKLLTIVDPNADAIYFWDDSADGWAAITLPSAMSINGTSLRLDETWVVALSDETTAITTGTNKATMVFPYDVTVVSVGCSVNTAGTGLTVDINEGGTTILSTKLTLDSGEKTSLTAATPAVISDASIAAGAEVGFDIDVASGTSKGLKVWLVVRRTS